MNMSSNDRFCFIAEWYDATAAMTRLFQLFYYVEDGSIEMVDVKNHRSYLKRTKLDGLSASDFFVGGHLNILSRHLKIVDYGDAHTRSQLSAASNVTLAIVKPDGMKSLGPILEAVNRVGLSITRLVQTKLSATEAAELYKEHQVKPLYNALVSYMSSGKIVALELMGEKAVDKWRSILGASDPMKAKVESPGSIRARYGTDETRNAAHGSDSEASAAKEISFFFQNARVGMSDVSVSDSTCCVIKPHAVKEGLLGQIVSRISDAGFQIGAIQMFTLDRAVAEEFLEIYRGVVQEYPGMVNEFISGPCVALQIQAENAPQKFREFCGPADPEIARHLRPRTLRAQFGRNKLQNAVHVTDLAEDAPLEVEYFFKILASS